LGNPGEGDVLRSLEGRVLLVSVGLGAAWRSVWGGERAAPVPSERPLGLLCTALCCIVRWFVCGFGVIYMLAFEFDVLICE